MDKIKASVIIPTFNRITLLTSTIRSLKEQAYTGYEIIVVDNACSEDVRCMVESEGADSTHAYSIRYLREEKIGLHSARHRGAKAAGGNILLYIDDDVLPDNDLVKEILKCYNDPDVGCVGGKILPKWEVNPPEWIHQFPKWYLSILDDDDGPKEVQWIYGCVFSIRKSLLFELGGFNPDAFGDRKMWWYRGDGEIGLLRKVHDAGKKVIYNPSAVAWHVIPKDRLTIEYFLERSFKSGLEESFSKYRYDKDPINPMKIMLRSINFGLKYVFNSLLSRIYDRNKHTRSVSASYYKARFLYGIKLSTDRDLQKFVKKENWL